MSIDVTTTEQQITASVSSGTVAVGVSGGVGPTGSQGPSGVVAVTAPITNSGSSTSANLGLSVGSGLQVAGGALAVAFTSTAFTSAVVAAAPAGGGLADAPSDGTTYGRKDAAWVDITSPANLQVRRGTAAEVAAITPLAGEPVWATDTKVLSVGDGSTAGGVRVGAWVGVAYAGDASHVTRDHSDFAQADPTLTITLGSAGVYFLKLRASFTAPDQSESGDADLAVVLDPANTTFIFGTTASDGNDEIGTPVGPSGYVYEREVLVVTSVDSVVFALNWGARQDTEGFGSIVRGNGYIWAMRLS